MTTIDLDNQSGKMKRVGNVGLMGTRGCYCGVRRAEGYLRLLYISSSVFCPSLQ